MLPWGLPGYTRTSRLGTQYFAHNPDGDGCSAGETAQHLLAKSIIVRAAIDAGWDAHPEYRGDGWIGDILVSKGTVRIVFKVQGSRQSLEEFIFRQQRYERAGIGGAWLARHTDGLEQPDPALPAFRLSGDTEMEATIDRDAMPLAEVVTRLLSHQVKFRRYVADSEPSAAQIDIHLTNCWKCRKQFAVWNFAELRVTGRCTRSDYCSRMEPVRSGQISMGTPRVGSRHPGSSRSSGQGTSVATGPDGPENHARE